MRARERVCTHLDESRHNGCLSIMSNAYVNRLMKRCALLCQTVAKSKHHSTDVIFFWWIQTSRPTDRKTDRPFYKQIMKLSNNTYARTHETQPPMAFFFLISITPIVSIISIICLYRCVSQPYDYDITNKPHLDW